jgi:hypothetical protein
VDSVWPAYLSASQKARSKDAFRGQLSPQTREPCSVGRCFSLAQVWQVSLSRSNRSCRVPVFLCCAAFREEELAAVTGISSNPVAARVDAGSEQKIVDTRNDYLTAGNDWPRSLPGYRRTGAGYLQVGWPPGTETHPFAGKPRADVIRDKDPAR